MPNTAQGVYYPDGATAVTPLHTVLANMSSTSAGLSYSNQVVANVAARDALTPVHNGMQVFTLAENTLWQRVNGAWEVLWRESTSPMILHGTANIATGGLAPNSIGTATGVTFPLVLPGSPVVVVGMARATSYHLGAGVSGEGPTGFTLTPRNMGASTTPGGQTAGFPWIAIY